MIQIKINEYQKKLNNIISNTSYNIYNLLNENSIITNNDTFEIQNRVINIPVTVSDIVVEGDNLSKTITFLINRYFDGIDLSEKTIKVNYINALGESSSTFVKNIQTDINTFTFDWTIESSTSAKFGIVKFAIECYEVQIINGNIEKVYIWQTKPQEFKVEQTIKVKGDALPVNYFYQEVFAESNDNNFVYTDLLDTDSPIQVSNRTILMPKISDIVISQDTLSQIVTFILPRYIDNVDLSTKILAIKYINADGMGDRSPISNMVVNDTNIHIGWAIDSRVTIKNGTVQFAIEAFNYDENHNFYCWQTKPATFQVEKGLNVDSIIIEPDPSWMQRWIISVENNIAIITDLKTEAQNSANDASGFAQTSQMYADQAQQIKDSTEIEYDVQDNRVGFKRKDEIGYTYTNDLTGPKGDKGDGLFKFYISASGDLICRFDERSATPSFRINSNGDLIWVADDPN